MGHPFTRIAALPLLVATIACTSWVAPRMVVRAPIDYDVPRLLYVTTNDERESLVAALGQAGFDVTTDTRDTSLVLIVSFGSTRSTSPCGYLRNVRYDLRKGAARVAVVKGRGWTGGCDPNILVQMGTELGRLFGTNP